MHSNAQLPFDGTKLTGKAAFHGFTRYLELSISIHAAIMCKSQQVEGIGLSSPFNPFAIPFGKSAKSNQSGLLRVERERKLMKSLVKL